MERSWRISGPLLTDEERRISTQEPGGLSGQRVDTTQLLGKVTGDRKVTVNPMLVALQGKHIYAGTVPPEVVEKRRQRNRVARRSRRINRLAAQR